MTPTFRAAWFVLLLWCLTLLPLASQAATTTGSGRIATETRRVPDFEAIALAGSIDLHVRQGAQPALEVSADDNLLPLLETRVESGPRGATLRVSWKRGATIVTRSRVVVNVVVPQLKSLSGAGAGDLTVESFDTPALQVSLAGAGDVKLPGLRTGELGVGISGSGVVSGSGHATKLAIRIAGSGDVRLDDLQADEVTVRIAGSGDAAVVAQKSLEVSVAGSGDVTYRGDATVRKSIMGSGSVTRK